MAQKVSVLLVDDIDGSDAHETIKFGLDGTHYEIDLNSDHAQELRGAAVALRQGGPQGHRTRRAISPGPHGH
jgi:Lsr2